MTKEVGLYLKEKMMSTLQYMMSHCGENTESISFMSKIAIRTQEEVGFYVFMCGDC